MGVMSVLEVPLFSVNKSGLIGPLMRLFMASSRTPALQSAFCDLLADKGFQERTKISAHQIMGETEHIIGAWTNHYFPGREEAILRAFGPFVGVPIEAFGAGEKGAEK